MIFFGFAEGVGQRLERKPFQLFACAHLLACALHAGKPLLDDAEIARHRPDRGAPVAGTLHSAGCVLPALIGGLQVDKAADIGKGLLALISRLPLVERAKVFALRVRQASRHLEDDARDQVFAVALDEKLRKEELDQASRRSLTEQPFTA